MSDPRTAGFVTEPGLRKDPNTLRSTLISTFTGQTLLHTGETSVRYSSHSTSLTPDFRIRSCQDPGWGSRRAKLPRFTLRTPASLVSGVDGGVTVPQMTTLSTVTSSLPSASLTVPVYTAGTGPGNGSPVPTGVCLQVTETKFRYLLRTTTRDRRPPRSGVTTAALTRTSRTRPPPPAHVRPPTPGTGFDEGRE